MEPKFRTWDFVPPMNEQNGCSKCKQKFYDPRGLPNCGHLVCGPSSPYRCVLETLKRRRCPVMSCNTKFPVTLSVKDLQCPLLEGTENFLSEPYKEILKKQKERENNASSSKTTVETSESRCQ